MEAKLSCVLLFHSCHRFIKLFPEKHQKNHQIQVKKKRKRRVLVVSKTVVMKVRKEASANELKSPFSAVKLK